MSISKSTDNLFSSGSISFSALKNTFGGGNSLSGYKRGSAVPDVSYNSSVPTSNSDIDFSDFRNTTKKITATCNGNFDQLNARWQIFGDQDWTATIEKVIEVTGNVGSTAVGQPAMRINQQCGGNVELKVNGMIYGRSGDRNGGAGSIGIWIASPVKVSDGDWGDRIIGGGGGGGRGGNGGNGGNGEHGGKKRCNGWFCNGSKRECYNNGGTGGNGGAGGEGGRGKGYVWNGSGWSLVHESGLAGSAGSAGTGSSGSGGNGGNGGDGGDRGSPGAAGNAGNTGNSGGNGESGCGGGPNSGNAGNAGENGGNSDAKWGGNSYRY